MYIVYNTTVHKYVIYKYEANVVLPATAAFGLEKKNFFPHCCSAACVCNLSSSLPPQTIATSSVIHFADTKLEDITIGHFIRVNCFHIYLFFIREWVYILGFGMTKFFVEEYEKSFLFHSMEM